MVRRERGIALALVLMTLVVGGALTPAIRGDGPARARRGLLVRIRAVSFPVPAGRAAVTVGIAGVTMNGNSSVSGYDSIPPTWTGCPPPDSAIGILSSGLIKTSNGGNKKRGGGRAPPQPN